MTKKMLVDATHPEETRVAIVDGNWLSDFDFERTSRKQLKGNIYLAKVIRIEPSLQAAFVEYGGNRHGFLPFSEIHPDYFRIPVADRPNDAPLDDDTGDEPEITGEERAEVEAYAAEMREAELAAQAEEFVHHPAPIDENTGAPLDDTLLGQMSEGVSRATEPAQPVAIAETVIQSEVIIQAGEFQAHTDDDHGLITDFGNAAIGSAPASDIVPIEIIGGEAVEEEQAPRRQPRPRYKIQEVVKRRQVMLIQVVKEERGNKGAALTSFLSLAGRYCVLMPNTDHGGGVSRKITSHQDRRRMKEILDQLEIPEGMAVILRTAGMEKEPAEIQRDLEYLLRLWNNIREQTLQSTAPALIYEEANLIKRSMRDLYSNEVSEILVAGQKGYQVAADFMRTIMPDHIDKVKLYEESVPLFFRYNVEKNIDQLYSPTVQLRSGGYIVINPTEALVSIDVNSGRSTRERHIESTALKTNLEAAEEIARQLRLRDLAGLVVIDFIDMEDGRNNAAVERRMKELMRADRARLQIGRISPFGLLELSRQRLHPSLMEINFEKCPHCTGIGLIRSVDSAAISILRLIEEEAIRHGATELVLHIPTKVALYILNQKREALVQIEQRYNLQVLLHSDDALVPPDYRIERVRGSGTLAVGPAVNNDQVMAETEAYNRSMSPEQDSSYAPSREGEPSQANSQNPNGNRRRGRYGAGRRNNNQNSPNGAYPDQPPSHHQNVAPPVDQSMANQPDAPNDEGDENIGNSVAATGANDGNPHDPSQARRGGRRRGRRGGRGRRADNPNAPRDPNAPPREASDNQNTQRSEGQRSENQRPEGQRSEGQRGGRPQRDQRGPRRDQQTQQPRQWDRPASNFAQPNSQPIPAHSVHDLLDTTPRDPRPASGAPARSPYEVNDQSDADKPKGGWWRRLTGQ